MAYRENLAKVLEHESSRLLEKAKEADLTAPELQRLEILCRCSKILADEEPPDDPTEQVDEGKLLSLAER